MNVPCKRVCLAALLLIVAGLTVSVAGQEKGVIPLKKGETIVFLGDSITAGGVGPKGYVTLIKNRLQEKQGDLGIKIIGAGISGHKVPDLQKRLDREIGRASCRERV